MHRIYQGPKNRPFANSDFLRKFCEQSFFAKLVNVECRIAKFEAKSAKFANVECRIADSQRPAKPAKIRHYSQKFDIIRKDPQIFPQKNVDFCEKRDIRKRRMSVCEYLLLYSQTSNVDFLRVFAVFDLFANTDRSIFRPLVKYLKIHFIFKKPGCCPI